MDRIYVKRTTAFISILLLLFTLTVNVFAVSEQGLPGEVGNDYNDDENGTLDGTSPFSQIMPRDGETGTDDDGETTDLPDGDHTTEQSPTTTRAPMNTTSPTTTGNAMEDAAGVMGGVWIILLLVLLAAVIVIIVAVVTKKK